MSIAEGSSYIVINCWEKCISSTMTFLDLSETLWQFIRAFLQKTNVAFTAVTIVRLHRVTEVNFSFRAHKLGYFFFQIV